MAKFEEHETRRRKPPLEGMVGYEPTISVGGRGRPRENREIKKRISLSVLPSLYQDIQRIAYVQRRSTSEVLGDLMEQFRAEHQSELKEYEELSSRGP